MKGIKDAARKMIEALPDDATWEDLMYVIYVREAVEAGLADAAAGRVISNEELRRSFEPGAVDEG